MARMAWTSELRNACNLLRPLKKSPLRERSMEKPCTTCSGRGILSHALDLCELCGGYGIIKKRCAQCWNWKSVFEFVSIRTFKLVRRCDGCTEKYKDWSSKSLSEREAATRPRSKIRADGPLRVKFVVESGNRKTGPIPVSMTSARTCPKNCAWYGRGCYAEQHLVSIHWRRLSDGDGIDWYAFLMMVRDLPEGQIWRHNEAGDLPGDDGHIELGQLWGLVKANVGKRGFTYTHKPLNFYNVDLLKRANAKGFTINVSADTLADADRAIDLGLPAVVVLPLDAPIKGNRTPAGRTVVVCPAEWNEKVTCERCGLCAVANRKSVVGFRAHGDRAAQMTERIEKRQLPLFQ
jgi:hypothetical protein